MRKWMIWLLVLAAACGLLLGAWMYGRDSEEPADLNLPPEPEWATKSGEEAKGEAATEEGEEKTEEVGATEESAPEGE